METSIHVTSLEYHKQHSIAITAEGTQYEGNDQTGCEKEKQELFIKTDCSSG